jgi:predicted HNH restriction endonuclease
MDDNLSKASLLAFFLSKHNEEAIKCVGYKTFSEAFKDIAKILSVKPTYIKLRRDEFDALNNGNRQGWNKRQPTSIVVRLYKEFNSKTFDELRQAALNILNENKSINKENIEKAKREINKGNKDEIESDADYIYEVNNSLENDDDNNQISYAPKEPRKQVTTVGEKYLRDSGISKQALKAAGYICEICGNEKLFLRKHGGTYYTEPHHLIPISLQFDTKFVKSLDNPANIISLCSFCHNLYTMDDSQIKSLYWKNFTINAKKNLSQQVYTFLSMNYLISIHSICDLTKPLQNKSCMI